MLKFNHPYHLVTLSPWPIINALNLMNLFMSLSIWFYLNMNIMFIMNSLNLIISSYQWWRDIVRESTFQGFHTFSIMKLMKFSMILFIISELLFFISLFWTFFHNSISPSMEIGLNWPPKNIIMLNPYNLPLLNSLILISSSFFLSWSHQCLLNNNLKNSINSLKNCILLGFIFSLIQFKEFKETLFCMNDSIFSSIFFMITGFHGIHVMIGILFLSTCFMRMINLHFSSIHHFHFEAASWYWHFVDVIWLFVYIYVYWWMF